MKKLLILVLTFGLANLPIADPALASQDAFELRPEATQLLSSKLPVYNAFDNHISLIEEFSVPSQYVVAHDANNESQNALVLLNANQQQGLSPSWYYLMMIIVLILVLLWDDEGFNKRKRKR